MVAAVSQPQDAGPRIEPEAYRDVMGRFVTGVTIVTCLDERRGRSHPWGTTVNAFSSVSLEPPLVLVCIGRERSIHPIIARAGRFAVNILGEDCQALSDCFAGAPGSRAKDAFCEAAYRLGQDGLPVLEASIAYIECLVEQTLEAGDHTIYLARVTGLGTSEVHPLPLLYYRGRYLRIERAATAALQGKPDERYPER
ncbi:MAG TPA: flavin reductase family protein [Candidatus Limnocylindrales bacterium]|nr:flavin reductase family protein [Candidatus Limnocylindrales bacterium]